MTFCETLAAAQDDFAKVSASGDKKEGKQTKYFAEKGISNDFEDLRFLKKNKKVATQQNYSTYIFARNYKYQNSLIVNNVIGHQIL